MDEQGLPGLQVRMRSERADGGRDDALPEPILGTLAGTDDLTDCFHPECVRQRRLDRATAAEAAVDLVEVQRRRGGLDDDLTGIGRWLLNLVDLASPGSPYRCTRQARMVTPKRNISRVPPDASHTREKLLDAAARAFAEDGVFNASLIEITRKAGQRNRAALHYHFGSRNGVLCAVIDRHAAVLARREGELLEIASHAPENDVAVVIEAIVRPAAELAESGWRGRCCLLIVAELAGEDPAQYSDELRDVLARTGGNEVYALLATRMADVSDDVRIERFALITTFILRAVADRARLLGRRGRKGRPQLEYEAFVRNLVAMAAAAMSAPGSCLT